MLRAATTVTVFATLLLGGATFDASGVAAAAPNPEANIPIGHLPANCPGSPLSASCESAVVGYLNDAHHDLGLAPYELPPAFLSLSPAKQVLILSDLDRLAYGLSPVLGLNDSLDAAAAEGVADNADPRAPTQLTPGGTVSGWGSNWAGGFVNVLVAYYEWMYDDGYGSPNRDCSSVGAPGCWGHRQNVLLSFGTAPSGSISMGAAAGSYPSHPGYTMLVAYTREAPAYTYTWATAVAEGVGRQEPPGTVTGAASSLKSGSATLNATVNPKGRTVEACFFEYGASEAYGSVAECAEAPGSGTTGVAVSASIAGVKAGTTYHFRIVATSAGGTTHGEDHTFTTQAGQHEEAKPPTIIAEPASAVVQDSATLKAAVNPNGAAVGSCRFEYGTTRGYGTSVACGSLPGSGTGPVQVSANILGLIAGTSYYYRPVAANAGGTTYGPVQVLTTSPSIAPSAPGSPELRPPAAHITVSAADAEVASTSLTASSSGTVKIKLRCLAGGTPCAGTIVLRTLTAVIASASDSHAARRRAAVLTLGHASFTAVGGRATTTVRLHLTARARRLIARVHVLRTRATILTRDMTGGAHIARTVVALHAAKSTRSA